MERKQKQLVNLNLDAEDVAMLDEMVAFVGPKARRPAMIASFIRRAYRRFQRRQENEKFAAEMNAQADAQQEQKDGAQ